MCMSQNQLKDVPLFGNHQLQLSDVYSNFSSNEVELIHGLSESQLEGKAGIGMEEESGIVKVDSRQD